MQARTWRWIRILGLLAAFAILVFMFRNTDPRDIWAAIAHMDVRFLIPVLVGTLAMPLARAVRLKFMMEPHHHRPSRRVLAVYNVGQLLNIMMPVLTGQVARVLLFSRTLGFTKTFAATLVILEVLFDGLILLVMVFGASFLFVMPDWMVRGEVMIFVATALLLGFFYFVLHHSKRNQGPPNWFHRHAPARVVREWDNIKASFVAGLNMLKSTRHLLLVSLLSLASWVAHAFIVLFLLRAFDFDVPFWGAMVILIVNTIVIMIPVSPGNIGTFQLACIIGLSFFGIPKDRALGFSILLHLAEVGPVFVLGTIASFSAHVRISEFHAEELLAEKERLAAQPLIIPEKADFVEDPLPPTSTSA
ncbi:MAG TPA: lysylphosphatidylglycerol synthase transmembrane domain-containing protein [bacterium]|nr:lysylphosphatidylglycerol synthase transmembrane domain-containing protein [bacterium]